MLPKHKTRFHILAHSKHVLQCLEVLTAQCKRSKIRTIKTVRLKMGMVRDILDRDQDINVVYLVRDPRAILASRWITRGRPYRMEQLLRETKRLCEVMEQDIRSYSDLHSLYKDRLKMVKYEDLAIETVRTANKIYDFLHIPIPNSVHHVIYQLTHAQLNDGSIGTNRRNSTATASLWKHALPNVIFKEMNIFCDNVLKQLTYHHNIEF
jgi:hypothetical protein